jgi:small subunit ribosomal protein S3
LGQKVNPIGFRIPLNRNWRSRWFADKRTFGTLLAEDDMIRAYVKKTFAEAAVSDIDIERYANRVRIIIATARPGVAIGNRRDKAPAAASSEAVPEATAKKEPNLIDQAGLELRRKTGREVYIELREVRDSVANAQLVAESIAQQLVRRMPLKRAMKRAQSDAMKAGVDGIKIYAAGRINGAEISRAEWMKEGKVPLHTLRANIEYGFAEAATTAGRIGVKVWICKKDDYQPMRQPSGRRDRERKPSHAPNA